MYIRNYHFYLKLTRVILLTVVITYIFIVIYVIRKEKTVLKKLTSTFTNYDKVVERFMSRHSSDVVIKPFSEASSVIAILVLVCNRTTVFRTMGQILKYRPNANQFPIVVSFDCAEEGKAILDLMRNKYFQVNIDVTLLEHPHYTVVSKVMKKAEVKSFWAQYYYLCAHYHWALNKTFYEFGYETVIIIEDDFDISPDIFEYFTATLPILKKDPTLWCVSAYNDNGKWELTNTSALSLLHRTDFFPGMGWMLRKSLWQELEPKWPKSFWDDWMREPVQRKGRACIRPEISRTKMYATNGASKGQFFEEHLKTIYLGERFTPFTRFNLSYLIRNQYDPIFKEKVNSAVSVKNLEELDEAIRSIDSTNNTVKKLYPPRSFSIEYKDENDFGRLGEDLNLMTDFKAGIPRVSYKGVVALMYRGQRVYFVPEHGI